MNYGYGWKKAVRERRAKARQKASGQRVQRVAAQVQVVSTGEIIKGRVFLQDLSIDGVGIFSERPLTPREEVFIVIEQPRPLFIRAQVAWCAMHILNVRIIAPEIFRYRIGLRFLFDTPSEQKAISHYCTELLKA